MRRYMLRRLGNAVVVMLGFTLFLFALLRLAPGSPIAQLLPEQHTQQQVVELTHQYGFDRPLYVQYAAFLGGLFTGDLGESIAFQSPAAPLVLERLPATIELALSAVFITVVVAIPLGILMAVKRRSAVDRVGTFVTLIGVSMPLFWLGALLIIAFSVKFQIFATSARGAPLTSALAALFEGDLAPLQDSIRHLVLPAFTLAAFEMAFLSRLMRGALLDELSQPYVRAARARGLPYGLVIAKHATRNALLPAVTILGLQLGTLLGGTVIIETVFAWPGVGQLLFQAVTGRDYPLAQAGILMIGIFMIVANLVVDLMYGWIDPRVRLS